VRLDTAQANYSYGKLQRVLEKSVTCVWSSGWTSILVLGLGGGSIIHSLRKNFNYKGLIDAVEIDSVCLDLAINYFQIKKLPGSINFIREDAAEFLKKTTGSWDLIIIDLFIDNKIPENIICEEFVQQTYFKLKSNGHIIFNVILKNDIQSLRTILKNLELKWTEKKILGNFVLFLPK